MFNTWGILIVKGSDCFPKINKWGREGSEDSQVDHNVVQLLINLP